MSDGDKIRSYLGSPAHLAELASTVASKEPTVAIREGEHEDAPGFQVFNPQSGNLWIVFGLPQGGKTREEAVFWAERLASNNGLIFERPEGWSDVVGALPSE